MNSEMEPSASGRCLDNVPSEQRVVGSGMNERLARYPAVSSPAGKDSGDEHLERTAILLFAWLRA